MVLTTATTMDILGTTFMRFEKKNWLYKRMYVQKKWSESTKQLY
jgi:hypothetical protein